MDPKLIYQMIASAVIVIVALVLRGIASASIKKKVRTQGLKPQSALLARKIITAFIMLIVVLALGFVWNVAPGNIWVSLVGIIAVVSIGFFAAWCFLSNIVAGVILLISRPFEIGDEIVFLPDNIRGTVTNISSMFLTLQDKDGGIITVPNNFVFQKVVKKVKKENRE